MARLIAGVSVPTAGDKAVLTTGDRGQFVDLVTIVSVVDAGRSADVEFDKKGRDEAPQLRVPLSMLGVVPEHHRHRVTDADTAREAARQSAATLTSNQRKVLATLQEAGQNGLIDHEHEARNGLGDDARKRRVELVELGLVEDSGRRRLTGRKAKAIVWVCTPSGRATVELLRLKGLL